MDVTEEESQLEYGKGLVPICVTACCSACVNSIWKVLRCGRDAGKMAFIIPSGNTDQGV